MGIQQINYLRLLRKKQINHQAYRIFLESVSKISSKKIIKIIKSNHFIVSNVKNTHINLLRKPRQGIVLSWWKESILLDLQHTYGP